MLLSIGNEDTVVLAIKHQSIQVKNLKVSLLMPCQFRRNNMVFLINGKGSIIYPYR